jgi:hypothetical protein
MCGRSSAVVPGFVGPLGTVISGTVTLVPSTRPVNPKPHHKVTDRPKVHHSGAWTHHYPRSGRIRLPAEEGGEVAEDGGPSAHRAKPGLPGSGMRLQVGVGPEQDDPRTGCLGTGQPRMQRFGPAWPALAPVDEDEVDVLRGWQVLGPVDPTN